MRKASCSEKFMDGYRAPVPGVVVIEDDVPARDDATINITPADT